MLLRSRSRRLDRPGRSNAAWVERGTRLIHWSRFGPSTAAVRGPRLQGRAPGGPRDRQPARAACTRRHAVRSARRPATVGAAGPGPAAAVAGPAGAVAGPAAAPASAGAAPVPGAIAVPGAAAVPGSGPAAVPRAAAAPGSGPVAVPGLPAVRRPG